VNTNDYQFIPVFTKHFLHTESFAAQFLELVSKGSHHVPKAIMVYTDVDIMVDCHLYLDNGQIRNRQS